MTLKERIMEATIDEFNEKGVKFTMDDLAKRLTMSKKSIYKVFKDKEILFIETVDYCFDMIKAGEASILADEELDIVEKVKSILIVLPERYSHIDWRKIYAGKEKFPKAYKEIKRRLETDWNGTIALIEQGIAENKIRPICIPVLKVMVQATIEQFLMNPVLIEYQVSYEEALEEMINIIIGGIQVVES